MTKILIASNNPGKLVPLLGLDREMDKHPLELTKAAQKRLALALAYGPRRRIVFLDEPSQYQDNTGFAMIIRAVAHMAMEGAAVAIISHDPRFHETLPEIPVIRLVQGGNG